MRMREVGVKIREDEGASCKGAPVRPRSCSEKGGWPSLRNVGVEQDAFGTCDPHSQAGAERSGRSLERSLALWMSREQRRLRWAGHAS